MKRILPFFGMGVYGFSREYRANQSDLTSNKFFCGLFNGILYAAPVLNIFPILRLFNRLEIEYKQLDKDKYKYEYTEITGECNDTI